MSFKSTGILTLKDLKKLGLIPPESRLKKGPVAIIECPEQIPCNICVDACPFKAIEMNKITDIPKVNWKRCTGCAICLSVCPGLSIFIVDLSRDDKALVTIPYEFLPVPKKGEEVILLNRSGKAVGKGKVIKIWERNKTWVVTIEVPKQLAMEVRAIWVKKSQ